MGRCAALLGLLLLLLAACWPQAGSQPMKYQLFKTLDLRIFACAPEPEPLVLGSAAELEGALARLAPHCRPEDFALLNQAFEKQLAQLKFDWNTQALVVAQEWYGTGMARAHLNFRTPAPDTLEVSIVWDVPPPPLTPDTTVFRGAFGVDKTQIKHLLIKGKAGKFRRFEF